MFKLIIGFAVYVFFWFAISYLYDGLKERSVKNETTIWYEDDDVLITYKKKPPHFRSVSGDDWDQILYCCGQCKNCVSGSGITRCRKHGVEYVGIGCVTKSVCDDYVSALLDD